MAPPALGARPQGATRPYTPAQRPVQPVRPPQRSYDHRYARPSARVVRPAPYAYRPPPRTVVYRNYYTRWYVHPYYRWTYATRAVVSFGFGCDPWSPYWSPTVRAGWNWVPGVWVSSVWYPGYWSPLRAAPMGYSFVPGYWDNDVYIDGWYRPERRDDGDWYWVDGYYLDDGTFVRGHWHPNKAGPEGYTWEPGFWDGETWIDGFWRPEYRPAFTWVSSFYDTDGIFHTGYWAPIQQEPGYIWIPGWFDGNQWVEGYWVPESEYQSTDPSSWQPAEGWNDGWEVEGWGDGQFVDPGQQQAAPPAGPSMPLGIPVEVEEL